MFYFSGRYRDDVVLHASLPPGLANMMLGGPEAESHDRTRIAEHAYQSTWLNKVWQALLLFMAHRSALK